MFEGFKQVLKLSSMTEFTMIFRELEVFMKNDYNIIVRSYLSSCLFMVDNMYFGKVRMWELVQKNWRDYGFDEKTEK